MLAFINSKSTLFAHAPAAVAAHGVGIASARSRCGGARSSTHMRDACCNLLRLYFGFLWVRGDELCSPHDGNCITVYKVYFGYLRACTVGREYGREKRVGLKRALQLVFFMLIIDLYRKGYKSHKVYFS